MAKSFLRWVGGKQDESLLTALLERGPKKPMRYAETFVGGGSLFFALREQGLVASAVLSDSNERLIRCYRGVRDNPAAVARQVEAWPVEPKFFAHARSWPVDSGTDVDVAAWLLYVNFAGYSGLYRVNKRGQFNVPIDPFRVGHRWQGRENLLAAAAALAKVELVHADFTQVLATFGGGLQATNTFFYFDPPYLPARSSAFANGYTSDGFGLPQHERLAFEAGRLAGRGCKVLASNSAAAADLWRSHGFRVETVEGARAVGARFKKAAKSENEILASR